LVIFRAGDFEAAALFALGRTAFDFIARVLTDDFDADLRVAVRDADRLRPFVTGLLIRQLDLKGGSSLQEPENVAELNIALLVNQREKGSCGHN